MKVLTIGFGGTGVTYSYILQKGGANVSCVARSNYESVKQNGIHFKSQKFGHHPGWRPDALLNGSEQASNEEFDYILYTAKLTPDVSPTEDVIRPYLSKTCSSSKKPVIVLIQNGVGIEDSVYQTLVVKEKLASSIISCVAWIGTNLIEGGTVVEHGALERLQMGIFPAQKVRDSTSDSSSSLESDNQSLKSFFEAYKAGGGGSELVEDIQPARWKKLLWNASWGALSTLSRTPVSSLLSPSSKPHSLPVVKALMSEVLAVGRSIGLTEEVFPESSAQDAMNVTLSPNSALSPTFKASLLIDLENQRPMELIPIIGNVVDRAKENGVQVPRLEMVLASLWPCQERFVRESREKLGLK